MRVPSPRVWVAAIAAMFLAYSGLLLYCDIDRPEYPGMNIDSRAGRVVIKELSAGSPTERAGLAVGDVLLAIDGHTVRHRLDIDTRDENLEFDRPRDFEVERDGLWRHISVTVGRAAPGDWRSGERLRLLGVRAMLFVTLMLGFFVAWSRPADPVALQGAFLLAAAGVFSLTMPYRVAAVWRGLPTLVGASMWLPFLASSGIGAVSFAFFAMFPNRPDRARPMWALTLIPMVVALAAYGAETMRTVYAPDDPGGVAIWPGRLLIYANAVYIAAALLLVALNYRALADPNARRRVRVLVMGAFTAALAGAPVVVWWYWKGSADLRHSLFESKAVSFAAVFFLVFPASFAYALQRHRLFDLGLMVRLGAQYALARGALLSIVPVVASILAFDVLAHGDRPLIAVLQGRGWTYALIAIVALVAYTQRRTWLAALDRRFLRERYDARQLLAQLLADMRQAGSLERVAPRVTDQIESALHPDFVAVLVRPPGESLYRSVASAPGDRAPHTLPAALKLVELIRVLHRPMEVARGDAAWLRQQLPEAERDLLRKTGIDLIVPVVLGSARAEALLALGTKRSEEPYSEEDQAVLVAIAESLAMLMERPAASDDVMQEPLVECPSCGTLQRATDTQCAEDGATMAPIRAPRTLAARYRLERRISRGGMGTVYAATDTILGRCVAVKVLRDELLSHPDAPGRFRQEARTAAQFAHPNVVTVHDVGVTDGNIGFLVMELLQGRSLRAALQESGRLPPLRALGIIQGVAAAVDQAHQRGLVHRDLKPDNIFLTRGGAVEIPKILDFGIAKSFATVFGVSTERETGTGVLIGTPAYMASEQLRGGEPHPAWDLWALGIVAYEMLMGQLPFAENPPWVAPGFDTAESQAVLGSVPAPWQAFFRRALAVDPRDRLATAQDFAVEFAGAVRADEMMAPDGLR